MGACEPINRACAICSSTLFGCGHGHLAGRLIDLFIHAVRLCGGSDPPRAAAAGASEGWEVRLLPKITAMGEMLLRLRAKAPVAPIGPPPPPAACKYGAAVPHSYIAGYPAGGSRTQASLAAAQTACDGVIDCTGVTLRAGRGGHTYELRAGPTTIKESTNETSWLILNSVACGHSGGAGPAAPGTAGLLVGAPEHDWQGVKTKFFFNNNVWALRGMQVLGRYLAQPFRAARVTARGSTGAHT